MSKAKPTCWPSTRRTDTPNDDEAIKVIRHRFAGNATGCGNVGTYDGAKELIRWHRRAKWGIGPGSICTDAGGSPARGAANSLRSWKRESREGTDVAIIADGGIKYSGTFRNRAGRGGILRDDWQPFCRDGEAPGETILFQGRTFKSYRGIGINWGEEAGSDRYAWSGQWGALQVGA